MKLRIKRQNTINEDDIATQTITDPNLLSQSMQLQNEKQKVQEEFNKAQEEFNKKQEEYNKKMEVINNKFAQLTKQQEAISKNTSNTQVQTESYNFVKGNHRLFESASKKSLLNDAISNVLELNAEYFSYDLSKDEIRRMARKINDFLTENKDNEITWVDDVRPMIKNYVLKHNTISWSQSEINDFNDLLEDELLEDDVYNEQFSEYM